MKPHLFFILIALGLLSLSPTFVATAQPLDDQQVTITGLPSSSASGPSLRISGDNLLLNDAPFRLLSGAFHFFRTPRTYWRDRLLKIRHAGLNTVETYLPWNLHEPRPGVFDFSKDLDVEAFFHEAKSLGLNVIARPGPYICAEWEMGGLPPWLLANGSRSIKLRSVDPAFLNAVDKYLDVVIPMLNRHAIYNGGPVIMLQIENEYMSYGHKHDVNYISYLRDAFVSRGIDPKRMVLFTSDNSNEFLDSPKDVLKTVNFGQGTNVREKIAMWRRAQPHGPFIVMEFWCGWFDSWEGPHQTRSAEDIVPTVNEILSLGGHLNFYMFAGGTSFGFLSGANSDYSGFHPQTTSYDYDAPISEAGDLTPKYYAFRQILLQYGPAPPPTDIVATMPKRAHGRVPFVAAVSLFDALPDLVPDGPVKSWEPLYREAYGQSYGLILYRTMQRHSRHTSSSKQDVILESLRDRAHVFIDGAFQGTAERVSPHAPSARVTVKLPPAPAKIQIDILVENRGRVNFGEDIADPKGIEGAKLGHWDFGRTLRDFEVFPLPLEPKDISRLNFTALNAGDLDYPFSVCIPSKKHPPFTPTFLLAKLNLSHVPDADTYLGLPTLRKGIAWINSRPLGRYWRVGPQRTLFVPRSYLRKGLNKLVVLELDGLTVGADKAGKVMQVDAVFGDRMEYAGW